MINQHPFQFLADTFNERPMLQGVVDVVLDKQPKNGAPVATIVHNSVKSGPITHVVTTCKPKGALFDHFKIESFRAKEEGPYASDQVHSQTSLMAHLIGQLRANP